MSAPPRPYQSGIVVAVPFVCVIREHDGEGWLTITAKGPAWLHGSRRAALADKCWLDAQRQRRQQ
jgi:hypothetical protein